MLCWTAGRIAGPAVVLLAAAAPAAAAAPFSFDAAPGRLPKDVVPLDYTIVVTPDIRAGTIAGSETVKLRVRKATGEIVFNSLNEKLSDVRLDGRPVSGLRSDDEQQLSTLTLAQPLRSGVHTLSFSYVAKLETQPHGLFVQSFVKADGTREQM
ncbi:MAG TPA: hypothetical protein VK695_08825, partial [Steroidobacteraceae bacterium]|nr:hypothetical protein [Steroidobacteraceae bacterium]